MVPLFYVAFLLFLVAKNLLLVVSNVSWLAVLLLPCAVIAFAIHRRRSAPIAAIRISPTGVTLSRNEGRNEHLPVDVLVITVDDSRGVIEIGDVTLRYRDFTSEDRTLLLAKLSELVGYDVTGTRRHEVV